MGLVIGIEAVIVCDPPIQIEGEKRDTVKEGGVALIVTFIKTGFDVQLASEINNVYVPLELVATLLSVGF